MVLGGFVGGFGWFWVVLGRFGWFRVLVTTIRIYIFTRIRSTAKTKLNYVADIVLDRKHTPYTPQSFPKSFALAIIAYRFLGSIISNFLIFQGQDNERHPFYVRSNWVPPVQPSVALETFLEEVKVELADIQLSKPKHNLPYNERMAIRELKGNSEINIKKADKGTTTVIMNKQDKIREGQEQLDNRTHYLLLDIPMAESTQERVQRIIDTLYREKHIDDITKKMAVSDT